MLASTLSAVLKLWNWTAHSRSAIALFRPFFVRDEVLEYGTFGLTEVDAKVQYGEGGAQAGVRAVTVNSSTASAAWTLYV